MMWIQVDDCNKFFLHWCLKFKSLTNNFLISLKFLWNQNIRLSYHHFIYIQYLGGLFKKSNIEFRQNIVSSARIQPIKSRKCFCQEMFCYTMKCFRPEVFSRTPSLKVLNSTLLYSLKQTHIWSNHKFYSKCKKFT